jgi:hypothetical protein
MTAKTVWIGQQIRVPAFVLVPFLGVFLWVFFLCFVHVRAFSSFLGETVWNAWSMCME